MRRLTGFSLAGLVLLLATTHQAVAQSDWGTLEVLVEGASGADGTPSLTFETRAIPKLDTVDVGPGRSFTDSGERLGTGAGRIVTPTVTVSELDTEASEHPSYFWDLTGDGQGRLWAIGTNKDRHHELFVFSGGSSWRRLSPPRYATALGRDAQGGVWTVKGVFVTHISGNTLTEYSGFKAGLACFAAGTGTTVWLGGSGDAREQGGAGNALTTLLRFDGHQWRLYGLADGLPDYGWADAIAVDSTGTVWAGLVSDVAEWDPPAAVYPPPLISYDGREWRGYEFPQLEDPGFGYWFETMGLLVDPGGSLWVAEPPRLLRSTSSGWMEYKHRALGGRDIVADRHGRIWMRGNDWIGVFESGQLHRTPRDSNPDVFTATAPQGKGLYYDEDNLWILSRRLGRWRLPGSRTSIEHVSGQHQSRLLASYPNPFNAHITLGFELDRRQPVSLLVYNLTGQRVATLAEGVYPEGSFAVSWDGRDDRGREVASGVYLCRLRLAEQVLSHSLTLVR